MESRARPLRALFSFNSLKNNNFTARAIDTHFICWFKKDRVLLNRRECTKAKPFASTPPLSLEGLTCPLCTKKNDASLISRTFLHNLFNIPFSPLAMDIDSLLELCAERGYDKKNLLLFEEAIYLAKQKLQALPRRGGESTFDHNLRVGTILAENHTAPEVVLAGLLHRMIDQVSEQIIKESFGVDVLSLVKGEFEIKTVQARNPLAEAETLRKILLTTFKDVRIIIVKLANKVANLRTIASLPTDDQKKIALEAREVYAPLAYRLGMDKIKAELEDLSLQVLDQAGYNKIITFLQQGGSMRDKALEETIREIQQAVKGKITLVSIKGRLKNVYGIYKKIHLKHYRLEELYDLLGVRIIVPDIRDCYQMLGILHEQYTPLDGRLKDYIANPKPNLYRSLHTALRLGSRVVEIQIRTPEMDELAEEGIAAHWRYKGVKSNELFEKKLAWLRSIIDLPQDENSDLLEAAKVDVFGDEIYCYTPKGEVKELPVGASILDFAYAVHEQIGHQAVGGKVNGHFFPLKYELHAGDVVEIVTNKSQRPRRGWIKFVQSSRAKQKIRKALKEYEKLPSFFYHRLKSLEPEESPLVEARSSPRTSCILAKCCYPLPGQNIVGLVTKRRLVSVHLADCCQIAPDEERWIEVQWKKTFGRKIVFSVFAAERRGLLADLLHTIASARFEVQEAKGKLLDAGRAQCIFTVVPRDLEQLQELIKLVQKVRSVQRVVFE